MTEQVFQQEGSIQRRRQDIFSNVAGFMTKITKNAAGGAIQITEYDVPVQLSRALTAGTNIVYLNTDNDLNLYFVGDTIAIREEDGTAEPLPGAKEEFKTIQAIDRNAFTLTLTANLANSYTLAYGTVYGCKQNEIFGATYDKVVASTELWKENF